MIVRPSTIGALVIAVAICAFPATALAQYPASGAQEPSTPGQDQATAGQQLEETRTGGRRISQFTVTHLAEELVTEASLNCSITQAVSPGEVGRGQLVFEVDCATGPGYLLVQGNPPQVFNCMVLAGEAARVRRADPLANVGTQCVLPENADNSEVLADFARGAGISCQVDGGGWAGRTQSGKERYEIGCAGVDGYWVDVPTDGSPSTKIECLEVVRNEQECRFTTMAEQAATVQARLAGSALAACQVQQARFAGANANGRFYEVKCGDGQGTMVRFDPQGAFSRTYDCAAAQGIGGGCRLTDTSALASAASERLVAQAGAVGFACQRTQDRRIGVEQGGSGRIVNEFACSDRPLGLVTVAPAEGSAGFEAFDCLTAANRQLVCTLTGADQIKEALSRQLQATGTNCTVAAFRPLGRIVEGAAEMFEVKCAGGAGYMADIPLNRTSAPAVRTCALAGREGDICSL